MAHVNHRSALSRRGFHLDDSERVARRFAALSTKEVLSETIRDITHNLSIYGISFEGRKLPVSLMPTVVPESELNSVKEAGLIIKKILERIVIKFIDEHRANILDGPMHRFFTPYYKWWDFIAEEVRTNSHILLMRYDAVRDDHGRWSFMETNTACPGGTIHCARIRDAWRMTKFGHEICRRETIKELPIDDPSSFVRFLNQKAIEIDPESPNIAILNYRGTYTNELESLRAKHAEMRQNGEVESGALVLGDIRDVECRDGKAYLNGLPIALIYNKIDQLQIDPNALEIQGWVQASKAAATEFLNSLGAIYLAETKRTLALLSDPNWNFYLQLTEEEEEAIKKVIPFTRLIEEYVEEDDLAKARPARERHSFVLKADALTRGSGVVIGDQTNERDWIQALQVVRGQHGIAQLKCHLPSRQSLHEGPDGELQTVTEYFGIDVFYFGDTFAGLVSRSHVNQIFNVGSGGRESPVIILGDQNE